MTGVSETVLEIVTSTQILVKFETVIRIRIRKVNDKS